MDTFRYVFLIFTSLNAVGFIEGGSYNYSREMLQKEFPGFGKDYVIFTDDNGKEVYAYLKSSNMARINIDIMNYTTYDPDRDLMFTLYNRNLPQGRKIPLNFKTLPKRVFDACKKTKFITHGWMSSGSSDICVSIKNNFLSKSDVNVFIMDWNSISGNVLYPIPMAATNWVGNIYSKFINNLIAKNKVNPKDVHLIGHSLGAHVSGFAGRRVAGKVARVTGLDPALPGFETGLITGGRLGPDDADFVDVIHTCAGYLGVKDPIGHADFYPNGGDPPQPGCGVLQLIEACSHGRSWKLFGNSIVLDHPYLASQCQSVKDLKTSNCVGNFTPMGEPASSNARGIYYVETTDTHPFLKPKLDFVDNNQLQN